MRAVHVSSSTKVTMQNRAHRTVAEALRNPTVVEFVRASVKAGYREFFGAYSDEVCGMVDHAFDRLSRSQSDGVDPGRAGEGRPRRSCMTPSKNRIRRSGSTGFITSTRRKPSRRLIFSGCRNCCRARAYWTTAAAAAIWLPGWRRVDTKFSPPTCWTTATPEARHLPFVQMTSADGHCLSGRQRGRGAGAGRASSHQSR